MFNKRFLIIILLVVVAGGAGLALSWRNEVGIEKGKIDLAKMNLPRSDLTGERCKNGKARPIAVMLASDPETRPLSGLAEADLVFEMPVTDGGVTRLMAVFQCHEPQEIGSVRSSRIDFIPLAQGLGAIYAHWGGEKEALARLNSGVIDNLDGLRYDGTIYYRKKGVRPPHNGFTSYRLLADEITRRGFNLSKSATVYAHQEGQSEGNEQPPVIYADEFEVRWVYQPETNSYQRWRDGEWETDPNLNRPLEATNVVLMKTTWSPINRDYIRTKTIGSGSATIYKNGIAISGTWEKKGAENKLFFFDLQKQEIKFSPGSIWIEIIINI